jgi:hypothetical protein
LRDDSGLRGQSRYGLVELGTTQVYARGLLVGPDSLTHITPMRPKRILAYVERKPTTATSSVFVLCWSAQIKCQLHGTLWDSISYYISPIGEDALENWRDYIARVERLTRGFSTDIAEDR